MMDSDAPTGDLMTSPPPPFTDAEAQKIAADLFGLPGSVSRLTSERDLNFHLKCTDGRSFVLKTSNIAETPEIVDLQTKALLHIEARDASLPTPRVVRDLNGEPVARATDAGGKSYMVRVLTWLEGKPLFQVEPTPALRAGIGATLARLDGVLASFEHSASSHELLWDMKHASRLRALLPHVSDEPLRRLVEQRLDYFDQNIMPHINELRWQIAHNDFNPYNILVDPTHHDRVAGVLDFGDMVRTPLVFDVATAASYQVTEQGHPLQLVSEFVAAFDDVMPLEDKEFDLLFDLVAMRLVMTITITSWRAARYPENAAYILRNFPKARTGLQRFATITREDARNYFKHACGRE